MSSLLVMAHPGHELPIAEFVRVHCPTVCVLTDGSGGAGTPRIARTRHLLSSLGCAQGPLFGMGSDATLYAWILAGENTRFVAWARTLAELIIEERFAYVVGDPLEGFNPVHDLCRYLVDAACRAAAARGWTGQNLTHTLDGPPGSTPLASGEVALRLTLDAVALDRKLALAQRYAELRNEVEAALREHGARVFADEVFYASTGNALAWDWTGTAPAYESHGRDRIGRGRYAQLITWREHVKPIADALALPIATPR